MGSAGVVFSDSHYIIKKEKNKKAKDFIREKMIIGRSKDGSGLATQERLQ